MAQNASCFGGEGALGAGLAQGLVAIQCAGLAQQPLQVVVQCLRVRGQWLLLARVVFLLPGVDVVVRISSVAARKAGAACLK